MAYGTHPERRYSYGAVNETNHRRFQEALGVETPDTTTRPSLADLPTDVRGEESAELAELGRAVREGLSDPLDVTLIATELSALADEFERLPELRADGIPEYGETPYQELTPAAWRINDHLSSVGFFESAEATLPSFTPEHITTTTRQLLGIESLTETLTDLGLPEEEQYALVTNVVNAREQLSWWERTNAYPPVESEDGYDEGVVHDHVAPLHQRAMEGSLLWIDGLDWWIWQHEVLITDEMIERAVWDVQSMLTGAYLLGDAALGLARGTIDDEDLTTMITASTAMMIIGQEFLADDIAWIDDERRKPLEEAHGGCEP